jgi:hypothetical protein
MDSQFARQSWWSIKQDERSTGMIAGMADYDINQLGSRPFEQLVVALCVRAIGAGIEAFGDGPDGGREATYDGPINWSATVNEAADRWTGYTVFQAKFHYNQGEPAANLIWLKKQIDGELNRWVDAMDKGSRLRAPNNIVFASNVRLSGVGVLGGIDQLNTHINKRLNDRRDRASKLGIRAARVWHHSTIVAFIDAYQSVRFSFPALLTVGDVLSRIGDNTSAGSSADLGPAMRLHAAQSLRNERWIRFSESGATSGQKAKLEEAGRDLPGVYEDRLGQAHTVQTVSYLINHADQVLRRVMKDRVKRPHWVIIGGPGQGKTTLSALIVQIYRSALLSRGDMTPEVADITTATFNAVNRSGISTPRNLRWPIRIDLVLYADELSSVPDLGVLGYLSKLIGNRSGRRISAGDLSGWLRIWPWIVVLDGLDEVSDASMRRLLIERITDFMEAADQLDADLMLVSTTRPLGYDERFDAELFTDLTLSRLNPAQAQRFGAELVATRLAEDLDKRDAVLRGLRDASKEPGTARLMETPLQVTIMSFIIESFRTLPLDRYSLFELYYRTVYQREIDKHGAHGLSALLNEHRPDVFHLHCQVALELHVAAEDSSRSEPTMPASRLDEIVRNRLLSQGYSPREVTAIATKLVKAATHRLVLLVPTDDRVGFEVRSMQELMAANALTTGNDTQILRALQIVAHHPHWRNTWLLAAGRVFKDRDHLHGALLDVVTACDQRSGGLHEAVRTSPMLACNVLDDGFASRVPSTRRAYVRVALTCLDGFPDFRFGEVALALSLACNAEDLESVFSTLALALDAGGLRQVNASLLLRSLRTHAPLKSDFVVRNHALPEEAKQTLSEWFAPSDGRRVPYKQDGRSGGQTIRSLLVSELEREEMFGLDVARSKTLLSCLDPFSNVDVYMDREFGDAVVSVDRSKPIVFEGLSAAIRDPDVEAALTLMLTSLGSEMWPVRATVQQCLRPIIARRPVGLTVVDAAGARR